MENGMADQVGANPGCKAQNWFEKQPLHGRQILLARTGTEKSKLANALKAQGANVIEFPKWIKRDVPVKEDILERIYSYTRILFASPECVNDFFELLAERNLDIFQIQADLYSLSVRSQKAVNRRGQETSLAAEMDLRGELLIVGVNEEKSFQYFYGEYEFFQTSEAILDEKSNHGFEEMLGEGVIDTVLFPSSRSVDIIMQNGELLGSKGMGLLKEAQICCMGKSSRSRLREYGMEPDIMPAAPNRLKLIRILKEFPHLRGIDI
ncbi:hypothetical protein [Mesobacillus harenae]|uniref:hypothetical protein n=1 Tax=Mesobacillus harenae TaxID=2213203 RepID=UPI00157FBEE4|nr:hypothetical protein [Mesobacillus harenae]